MSTKTSRGIGWLATILVVVGALNWGLVGLFNFNLVTAIFGKIPMLARGIYVVVGLAGLYLIYFTRALSHGAHEHRPIHAGAV